MNVEQLLQIMPNAKEHVYVFVGPLNIAMDEYEINTLQRQASFISQVAHESAQLRYVRELATGEAYEGRVDLGNTVPGDGVRFKGRGLLQITGRNNYQACGEALSLNLITYPELLEAPVNACRSAAWFWKLHGLNELADIGKQILITRRINGGYNGLQERIALFNIATRVLT